MKIDACQYSLTKTLFTIGNVLVFRNSMNRFKEFVAGLAILLFVLAIFPKNIGAQSIISINSDGIVEGTDKIQRDGDVYTLLDDISVGIFIQKSNITFDGAGFTIRGAGQGGMGIDLSNNPGSVTIKNVQIRDFDTGIKIVNTNNNKIIGNYFVNCFLGIDIKSYPNDVIIENNTFVKSPISIAYSNGTHVFTKNSFILGATIIFWLSPEPDVYMNYWSPYQGTDSDGDGTGDSPFVYISTDYAKYSDNQPLMEPVPIIPELSSWIFVPLFTIGTLVILVVKKHGFWIHCFNS